MEQIVLDGLSNRPCVKGLNYSRRNQISLLHQCVCLIPRTYTCLGVFCTCMYIYVYVVCVYTQCDHLHAKPPRNLSIVAVAVFSFMNANLSFRLICQKKNQLYSCHTPFYGMSEHFLQ